MAYKYDIFRGHLKPTTPHHAYGLQGLKPPLPLNYEPSKIVWSQDPAHSAAAENAKRLLKIRAMLEGSDALVHLRGRMARRIYSPTMIFLGIGCTIAGYKLFRLAFLVG